MRHHTQKHAAEYPSARNIRRSCSKELYRTAKRLRIWIPKNKMELAEALYYKKVITHLQWIAEHQRNRKAQADWWDEHVSADIAELWEIDRIRLCQAFRDAYGG